MPQIDVKAMQAWQMARFATTEERGSRAPFRIAPWKVALILGRETFFSAKTYPSKSSAQSAANRIRKKVDATEAIEVEKE